MDVVPAGAADACPQEIGDIMTLNVVSRSRCFDGTQHTYQHRSSETGTMMRFAAFVPPQARQSPVPVVGYLSGLTCTEENFTTKAGAQRIAGELGLSIVNAIWSSASSICSST